MIGVSCVEKHFTFIHIIFKNRELTLTSQSLIDEGWLWSVEDAMATVGESEPL